MQQARGADGVWFLVHAAFVLGVLLVSVQRQPTSQICSRIAPHGCCERSRSSATRESHARCCGVSRTRTSQASGRSIRAF